ncbi:hypothetical protein TNCV_4494421 [Trichonephila clavipes]|nr:hypothetical protein TNCV_4494421 [Trichonephila clavipes]
MPLAACSKREDVIVACSHSSLVVKVSDLWLVCHEFEPSTKEDPPFTGAMPVKSVEAQTSSRCCGVVVRREGASSGVVVRSLGHGPTPKPRETGKLEDRARAGRPCLKEARAPCIAVEMEAIASEAASGTNSAREAARRLNLPPSSLRNILRRILHL